MRSLVINCLLALSFFSMMARADELGDGNLSTEDVVFAQETAGVEISTTERGGRKAEEITSGSDNQWSSELLPPMPAWDPNGPRESLDTP